MHIMLDMEFMSLAKDAAIASIGAVRFDPEIGNMEDTFYQVVNLKSAQRAGGRIDADTVMFWLQQSEAARSTLYSDESILIEPALRNFAAWLREKPLEGLWGNGSDCDNVILEGAYLRLGMTPPWTYRDNRCYRTLRGIFPQIQADITVGVAHHALDDAKYQAHHLCKIWKHIKGE